MFCTDGVEPSRDLTGWQLSLAGWGLCGRMYRAAVYPLLAMLSPLVFLGYRSLLVPSSFPLAVLLAALGAFGVLSLIMLVFGLRRRSKISSGM